MVPDIMALASPGERAECRREAPQRQNAIGGHEGVKGLRALGVRDLSYRLAFIANSVQVCLKNIALQGLLSMFLCILPLILKFCQSFSRYPVREGIVYGTGEEMVMMMIDRSLR